MELMESGVSRTARSQQLCQGHRKVQETEDRRYDAVIFDLDGTLLDTLLDLANSVNATMRLFQMPERTVDEVCAFVGNGIRRLMDQCVPGGNENPQYEAAYEAFLKHYGDHCMEETEPYPGILSLLEGLQKKGYRMAIVSNKADFAVKKLSKVYFGSLIDVAIGEREGIRKKPAPDTVLQALAELGADRARAVYIGDSDVDLETAKNAGMDVISVSWGFRSREFLLAHGAAPEWICANVREVNELIHAGRACVHLQ